MATFGNPIMTPDPEDDQDETGGILDDQDDDGDVLVEVPYEEGEEEESSGELFGEVMADDHGENLSEGMDDDDLAKIATSVVDGYENDRQSRAEWAKSYVKGLDLLGLNIEDRTQPWQGASGVFHPVLMESVIRFEAQAIGELFPASGPARTKVVGKQTREKLEQAQRVERELNYELTEEMVEYREEMEQMLFHLPLAGSAFKKVFYDPIEKRPCALFVPAEELVVNYGTTSLEKSERFTHVMKKTSEELEALMNVGFYADVDLGEASEMLSDIQEKYDELAGESRSYTDDDRHTVLEQHVLMRLTDDDDDEPLPYIVSVDYGSTKVLSIRRNWQEVDDSKRKRMHFVHYRYLPGMGFYGIGMIHLLGGLTKTATSILRQLIDSGTLANLPAGLKSRGLRIKGDNTPFRPGEFRDVDVPGSAIKDHITFLPYKEPSAVLYNLLGSVIEEARRIGAVAETELTSMKEDMPVGTAFAILERQMKVMTGVQARLHAALKRELKLVSKVIYENMNSTYAWDDEEQFNRKEDFDGRVDIVPVSDPNAATTAQKVVSYQAAMQMAQQAPQLYNMGKLHRQMLDIMGIENADEILKLPEDIKPADPVSENMSMMKQEPVKAFMYQDHEAHIAVHMAAISDPKIQQIVGQSPFASAIQSAMSAHMTEHVAMQYRKEIEKNLGVSMPAMDEVLPEDVEVELSRVTAMAAEKLLAANKAEVADEEAAKQEADPLTQIQQREIALKEKRLELDAKQEENKNEIAKMELELKAFSSGSNIAHMRERLNSEEARAAGNLAVKLRSEQSGDDKTMIEAAKLALEQANRLKDSGNID